MKKITRPLALLLCLALLLTAFCACTSKEEKQMQKVIGTCAGFDVLYEELRYVTLTYKDMFAATYGEYIWDTEESAENYRAELEETVWRVMLNNYAVLALCAEYMPGITMEEKAIKEAIDKEIEDADITPHDLEKMYLTEHFLRFVIGVAELENELRFVLADDLGILENDEKEFAKWLADGNCVYVQHIFIRNDLEDDPEENRARAEEVRTALQNGADISEFIGSAAYNEDTTNLTPYFLVRDVYKEALQNAALELTRPGDVSYVVDNGDGYYVFQCMEYGEATLAAELPELLRSWQWAKLEEMANEKKEGLSVILNEYGKTIDLLAIQ